MPDVVPFVRYSEVVSGRSRWYSCARCGLTAISELIDVTSCRSCEADGFQIATTFLGHVATNETPVSVPAEYLTYPPRLKEWFDGLGVGID